MILFVKVEKITYQTDTNWGALAAINKRTKLLINGRGTPPKPLKTGQYQIQGEYRPHPRYGKVFVVDKYLRNDITNEQPIPRYLREFKPKEI